MLNDIKKWNFLIGLFPVSTPVNGLAMTEAVYEGAHIAVWEHETQDSAPLALDPVHVRNP